MKNPDLLSETALINVLYDDFWGTPLTHSGSHKSYRPLCVLTFRLNYALDKLNPWGYHLTNVLLHALVTAVFTYTAGQLLVHKVPTFTAGLLFASHPIHTEAVAGIVGRADILACLFFLLAFLCYKRYCKYRDKSWHIKGVKTASPKHYLTGRCMVLVGVAICTAASMLCKELGVTVLAVCVTYDLFVQNSIKVTNIIHVLYQVSLSINTNNIEKNSLLKCNEDFNFLNTILHYVNAHARVNTLPRFYLLPLKTSKNKFSHLLLLFQCLG